MEQPKANFTTSRPVAVLMVFVALVVYGFFSFQRLPVTLMPELNYPTLTVRTEYPGAAPEEVENEISRPIEEAIGVVAGLNRISSISRAGISDVVMEFVWGTGMSEAAQNTLEKLDLVFLPQEAERPLILHFDPSLDPIMELSFSGEGKRYEGEQGLRRLRRIADLQIKRALEPIKGVAAVRVRGGLEEEIHVLLDEQALLRSKVSIQTVIDRLRQENINVAGGTIQEGRSEYMVRTLNEYENVQQIEDTVVKRIEDRELRIKDLGTVVWAQREREIITRTEGAESVQIDIYKEADANIVAVANQVRGTIGELLRSKEGEPPPKRGFQFFKMPGKQEGLASRLFKEEGGSLRVVADRSLFIESSINEVRNTAIIGGLLAVVVLFLFLNNLKTTAIVAISIPMSLIITFAPLHLFGVSLNIMSLGGLALGVGMLVDSSIVVLESIFRCREEGDEIKPAAIRGTAEVRGAVIASTLTSVAVFFPLVFVEGIAGQAFGDLALAVVISLLASLVVAIFFIPMLASREPIRLNDHAAARGRWFKFAVWEQFVASWRSTRPIWLPLAAPYYIVRLLAGTVFELIGKLLLLLFVLLTSLITRGAAPMAGFVGGILIRKPMQAAGALLDFLTRLYPRVIRWALVNLVAVAVIVLATFYLTWHMAVRLETELLPEVHQSEFTFEVSLPVGTPLEETAAVLGRVEKAILEDRENLSSVLVTFGYDVTNIKRSDEGEHSARFKILLEGGRDPALTEQRVLERLRSHFADIPDINVHLARPVLFSSKTPIVVEVHGDDLDGLRTMSRKVQSVMAGLEELADVETTLKSGAPEIQVNYRRDRLMRYGLNINQVAQQVRNMVKGFEATLFNMRDRRIPILVRLEERDREYISDIGRLTVNAGGEQPIPLNSIAELELGEGPSEIRRIDGNRVALVQANLASGALGAAVGRINTALREQITWPADMSFFITGQNEEWERSRGSLFLALGLSLFLVYVIMASQFESLLQPLIIMFTVPLAFFGTVLGLMLLGMSVSIVVFLGAIMLVGIVVNNAIVLIDYVNRLKARGIPTDQAIVTAGQVRLRPILMTTGTTVLGLLPMALGLGDGAEVRTPMAVTVIFGLVTSTLLTLLVIPALYSLLDRARAKLVKPGPLS